jgi:hypothetical protein
VDAETGIEAISLVVVLVGSMTASID